MGNRTAFKKMVGAPAAMILAAAVTAAISSDCIASPAQPALSWALDASAGSSINTQNARAFLAQHAARKIQELDRAFCAAPQLFTESAGIPTDCLSTAVEFGAFDTPQFSPTASSHQHAAP